MTPLTVFSVSSHPSSPSPLPGEEQVSWRVSQRLLQSRSSPWSSCSSRTCTWVIPACWQVAANSGQKILLANLPARLAKGVRRERAEIARTGRKPGFVVSLQFLHGNTSSPNCSSQKNGLPGVHIEAALCALRRFFVFEGLPAVSSDHLLPWSYGVVRLQRMTFQFW